MQISGTPWARRYLTDADRAAIRRLVPARRVRQVSLGACRRPGEWSAYLIRRGGPADPLGVGRHAVTMPAAVAAAVHDASLGAPLAWCSHCSKPARFQRNGEAFCGRHEANRGGTIG